MWNLADLIAIAATPEHADLEAPPSPALLSGAQYYAARDATAEQWASAADVARDPAIAGRMRMWAASMAPDVGGEDYCAILSRSRHEAVEQRGDTWEQACQRFPDGGAL